MDELLGQKLCAIQPMTKEMAEEFWPGASWGFEGNVVLVFENGTKLVASQDPEGNGPGCMFGHDINGTHFTLIIQTMTLDERIEDKRKKHGRKKTG